MLDNHGIVAVHLCAPSHFAFVYCASTGALYGLQAYTKGVREVLADEKVYDPKVYGKLAKEYVKRLVMDRIKVCKG